MPAAFSLPEGFPAELEAPICAGVVIEVLPGTREAVSAGLVSVEGLEIVGDDGETRLAGVWRARSSKALESAVEQLLRGDERLIGIFPTFIGSEEGDEPTGEEPTGEEPTA